MTPSVAVFFHLGIGSVALCCYWAALLTRKGSRVHRLAGKICLAALVVVGLSVGPILFTRPPPFDPGWVVQMVYLTMCLFTVSMISLTAIRFRLEPDRFRGRAFPALGYVLLALGLVVLVAGLAKGDPVAIVLSWVGLVFGPAMIAFARYKGDLHPRWWLGWHLNANCALFNAVNGTFLFVVARWLGFSDDTTGPQVAFQLLTIAVAAVLRVWLGARFGAPIRFGSYSPRRRTMVPTSIDA
jgi:uncharacterized membrane protein